VDKEGAESWSTEEVVSALAMIIQGSLVDAEITLRDDELLKVSSEVLK